MYVPTAFAVTDLAQLHGLMEQYSFALLVSQGAATSVATHLPLLLDRQAGPSGTLYGHVSRANPQWFDWNQQQVLTVFSGPHSYISPQWYAAENVVPTWNYVAVHATGCVELISDREQLRLLVRQMVGVYEQSLPSPWSLPEVASRYEDRMLDQIVGFRIPLDSITGQWKLNQHHPVDQRQKVSAQLRQRADQNSREIAAMMEASCVGRSRHD